MKIINKTIGGPDALVIGEDSDKVYLYLHGKCGFKEEALDFAERAAHKGYQVVSVDLPRHGARKSEATELLPWIVTEELQRVYADLEKNWRHIFLRATSIGAWLAMMALSDRSIERCLFVSPVVDMEKLIGKMMLWSCVTERELQKKESIPTDLGEVLSWRYLCWVREHPVVWNTPTKILYGERDSLTGKNTMEDFCLQHNAELFTIPGAEHYISEKTHLRILHRWEEDNL